MKLETKAIHAGESRKLIEGAVVPPIFVSAPYQYPNENPDSPVLYPRLSNTPTHRMVAEKLAALEGADAGLVTSSGMAAISTTLLALVAPGQHVLAHEGLYGGSYQFFRKDFAHLGRQVTFFRNEDSSDLSKKLQPNTKVIYLESVSNPLLRVPDLRAVARVASERGIAAVIDNTFPTPVNFNPIDCGFPIVIHSATKYLNGHSDLVAGCIVGKKELIGQITQLFEHLGGSLDGHACYMLNRGLKTLPLRVRHQNETALRVAQALEKHAKIDRVLYPGLESHPDYRTAKELFRGFGGMLSFEYAGSGEETHQMLTRLRIPFIAPSLGGAESLVTRPVETSHSWLSPSDRQKLGIKDNLVRVSIGLESSEDLIEDFLEALQKTQ